MRVRYHIEDVDARLVLAWILGGTDRVDEVFSPLEPILPEAVSNGTLRASLFNQRAWVCFLRGDPALMQRADDESKQACSLSPDNPNFADTRGHILVWMGRHAEARKPLEFAYENVKLPQSKASAACGLAKVCAAAGAQAEALQWLERARHEDSSNTLLASAQAAVAALEGRAPPGPTPSERALP